MSNINTTILANSPAQPRPALAMSDDFGPVAAAFFLIFDCEIVRPSLTNPESNTYKRSLHGITQTVNP